MSIEQQMSALRVADERRLRSARFKRDLQSMTPAMAMRTVAAALVLGDRLGQVGRLVEAIPTLGRGRTRRLLVSARIKPMVKTGELSEIQRFRLAGNLRALAQHREAYEARRDRSNRKLAA